MNRKGLGWLICWRKPKESILIGKDVEVYVSKIKGDMVWLAVKAPYYTRVIRKETLEIPEPKEDESQDDHEFNR
jgi:carbon storage regulator CsrA